MKLNKDYLLGARGKVRVGIEEGCLVFHTSMHSQSFLNCVTFKWKEWIKKASQHNSAVKETCAMSDLGIFFYFYFLLVGGFCHFFQVRILNPVHELDVLLQHQPLGKGPPGVWAVPVEPKTRGWPAYSKGTHGEGCRRSWKTFATNSTHRGQDDLCEYQCSTVK